MEDQQLFFGNFICRLTYLSFPFFPADYPSVFASVPMAKTEFLDY
jgi:hypothetical protein